MITVLSSFLIRSLQILNESNQLTCNIFLFQQQIPVLIVSAQQSPYVHLPETSSLINLEKLEGSHRLSEVFFDEEKSAEYQFKLV